MDSEFLIIVDSDGDQYDQDIVEPDGENWNLDAVLEISVEVMNMFRQ